jgi:TPR repeat protein
VEATPTPAPIAKATPEPGPTKPTTPAPDPHEAALAAAIRNAQDMAVLENYEGALNLLDDLLRGNPNDADRIKGETEKIIAKLGSETSDWLSPERLKTLGSLLDDASQRGSMAAQMLLAKSYLPDDPDRAFKYFFLAASNGNSEAMSELGDLYADGRGGMGQRDYAEAVKWYGKAADLYYPPAIYALAECYYTGKGFDGKRDVAKAYEKLRLAAYGYGERHAEVLLGDLFRNGEVGDAPNYVEAARLWQKAAAKGDDEAKTKLIVMAYNGEILNGVPVTGKPDPDRADAMGAFAQFKAEAENDNRSSMYYYSLCLLGAIHGVEDSALGREMMIKAATLGDRQAQKFCSERNWKFGEAPR